MMKRFLAILVLGLLFYNVSFSDAKSDECFAIEDMCIGDSLLQFYDEEEIKKNIVNWYDHINDKTFKTTALKEDSFKFYEYVDINFKANDKNYKIYSINGVLYFGVDSEIKDINECYVKQKEVAKELSLIFKNSKKIGPITSKHNMDPSGESTYTDIVFLLDAAGTQAGVSCYDYADHITKERGSIDFFSVSMRTKEFDEWLGN